MTTYNYCKKKDPYNDPICHNTNISDISLFLKFLQVLTPQMTRKKIHIKPKTSKSSAWEVSPKIRNRQINSKRIDEQPTKGSKY